MTRFNKIIKEIIVFAFSLFLPLCSSAQDIQNVFFNMKLGNHVSIQSIKTNVGNRGEYEEVKDMGVNWKRISFGRLLFAGERWMRGSFDITASGSFFEFSVRNAYRSKQEADTFYNYMKRRLEEKYTGGIEDNEESLRSLYFFGDEDGASVNLDLSYQKAGGNNREWFFWVELVYYHQNLLDKMIKSNQSEL